MTRRPAVRSESSRLGRTAAWTRSNRVLLICASLTSLSACGYGVMFALLDDYRDQYGISNTSAGLIVSVGFLSAFFAQVLLAPLADRGHARQLVYLGNAIQIGGFALMALSHSAWPLIGARLVTGLGAGMAMPAQRRIVVLSDPNGVGRNLGLLFSFDVGGFALGPAIGVLVGGLSRPFVIVGGLLAIALVMVRGINIQENERSEVAQRFAFDLFRNRRFAAGVLFGVGLFLMVGTFDALWVLVLDDLNAPLWIKSFGIVAFSVPFVLFGTIGGRLSQRVGPFRLATIGLSIGTVAMFSYGYLPTAGLMFTIALLHGLNDGVTASSSSIGVGLAVPLERQASAQGMLGGFQTLTGGIAAAGAGWLYDHHGRTWAYSACAGLILITVTAAVALGRPLGATRTAPEAVSVPNAVSR